MITRASNGYVPVMESTSRPRGCERSSSTSQPSARRRVLGGRSLSRRLRRYCGSQPKIRLGRGWLGFGLGRAGKLAQTREEQRLVDPTVEDRDAQLNALDDHVSSLQASLACELGGRQVIGHRSFPPLPFTT